MISHKRRQQEKAACPRSIPRFLAESAAAPARKDGHRLPARSVTFGELHHEALATAECLRELGIKPGDRVGICMEKTVDQVSAILGVLCANGVRGADPAAPEGSRTSATSSRTRAWPR